MRGVRLRRAVKDSAAEILHRSGVLRLRRSAYYRRQCVCVLGLHRVVREDDWQRMNSLPSISLREQTFAAMLDYLAAEYTVLSQDQFLALDFAATPPRRPWCLITFDDGWADTATRAFPLLQQRSLPATVFLTTGVLGGKTGFWVERFVRAWRDPRQGEHIRAVLSTIPAATSAAGELETAIEYLKHRSEAQRRPLLDTLLELQSTAPDDVDRMMTWDEVRELDRGGISFGGHTVTHPLLNYESEDAVQAELRNCKREIEERLGKPVRTFAYPNGTWDARVRDCTAAAGYEAAFSTRHGWFAPGDDRFTIRRVLLHEGCVTNSEGKFSPAQFELTLSRTS